MVLLATLIAIALGFWLGAPRLALGLMSAGFLVHLALALRLLGLSTGGVGGHAEWVRDRSARARLRASPAWLVGLVLVGLGLGVALWR